MKFQCGKCNHLMDSAPNYCTACGVQLSDRGVVGPADLKRLASVIAKAGKVIVGGKEQSGKLTPAKKFFRGANVEIELAKVTSYVLKNGVPVLTLADSASLNDAKLECLECGHKFKKSVKTGSEPKCPKCGGYDVELSDASSLSDATTDLKDIGDAIKGKSFFDLVSVLKKVPGVTDVKSMTEPFPAYFVTLNGKALVVVNRDYVDEPDLVVGKYAIGYV
jgi:Zn finger protein HypA/HybF involved in hydrogenase expression